MIEQRPTSRDDVLEFHISGTVTDDDYKNVLIPALDEAIAASDRVRLLVVLSSGLGDFTLDALMDDTRTGLKHWSGFDRIAVVTGSTGMKHAVRAMSVFMRCPVMVFAPGEEDDARRWLVESLGSIHQTDLGDGVLHVALLGKLDPAAYEAETEDLDAFIRRNERFRLLLDLREFDGWQGLGGLAEHLKLVRDHAPLLDRVAVLGDAGWQKMAARLADRTLRVEARFFPSEQMDSAVTWLREEA